MLKKELQMRLKMLKNESLINLLLTFFIHALFHNLRSKLGKMLMKALDIWLGTPLISFASHTSLEHQKQMSCELGFDF